MSNNKKAVDLRVWYGTLLKTKEKNEKSIENKSNVYSQANRENGHISKSTLYIAIKASHMIFPHQGPFSEPWSQL